MARTDPTCPLTTDILVVGAGVMGLWAAVKFARTGRSVLVLDRTGPGAGASGGLLGALFPWMPDRWDVKKQFQFDALVDLPAELALLEAETGLSAGFARVGRIVPLPRPHLAKIAARHQADALINWHQRNSRFFWHLAGDAPPFLDPGSCASGHVHDTLAARISPRGLMRVLTAWLAAQPNVRILAPASLVSLDAEAGKAEVNLSHLVTKDITTIDFTHAVVAAGVESFPILQALVPGFSHPLGHGVKGQAALLDARLDPTTPMVFLDGCYVVVHEDGSAAIGSTSEDEFADPHGTDDQLETVIEKARAMMPALRSAPVIERWAGVRPKAMLRDPMIGPVPGQANVLAMTGGFKISFGIAHRLADCLVDAVEGCPSQHLPQSFTLAGQLVAATSSASKPVLL